MYTTYCAANVYIFVYIFIGAPIIRIIQYIIVLIRWLLTLVVKLEKALNLDVFVEYKLPVLYFIWDFQYVFSVREVYNSALLLAYDYIVTQNKNNTDIIYLNIVVKDTAVTTLKNTYNFKRYIACLYGTTSWITGQLAWKNLTFKVL